MANNTNSRPIAGLPQKTIKVDTSPVPIVQLKLCNSGSNATRQTVPPKLVVINCPRFMKNASENHNSFDSSSSLLSNSNRVDANIVQQTRPSKFITVHSPRFKKKPSVNHSGLCSSTSPRMKLDNINSNTMRRTITTHVSVDNSPRFMMGPSANHNNTFCSSTSQLQSAMGFAGGVISWSPIYKKLVYTTPSAEVFSVKICGMLFKIFWSTTRYHQDIWHLLILCYSNYQELLLC